MKRFSIACACALLALAGCSSTTETNSTDEGAINLVATTSVWADVAATVAGDGTQVTPIISGKDVDPHSFEPVASDMAALEHADIIVANGGGYDAWAYANLDDGQKANVVSPLPLTPHGEESGAHQHGDAENGEEEHHHHHEHGSEHVWYDPHAIEHVMNDVAEKITELGGTATVEEASARAESLEPPAAALDEFLTTLSSGKVDVLIFNPSTATDTSQRIRETAEKAHVKIVEIAEVPPQGTNFLDYFDTLLDALKEALS